MNAVRDTALQLAARGIPVLPLFSIGPDGKCTCGEHKPCKKGKHPRTKHGVDDASTDPKVVARWWDLWPDANVGVATGKRSGLVVVDLDSKEALRFFEALVGKESLQKTLVVGTGSGGMHIYYKYPGYPVSNKVRIPGSPDTDIRGDGGYVVVPPSSHQSGRPYAWVTSVPFGKVAELPEPVSALLNKAGRGSDLNTEYTWEQLIPEGSRDNEVARRAGKLLRGGTPPSVVLRTMQELNKELCVPPLPDADVRRIVESIARKELAKGQNGKAQAEEAKKAPPVSFSLIPFSEAVRKYGGYETRWTVPDWLPEATVGLVVAPPSNYKTWLLADICTAVAGARPFLGRIPVNRPGPVMIIQQEDFLPMLIARISTILGAELPQIEGGYENLPLLKDDLPLYIHDRRQLHFDDPASVAGFYAKLKEVRPVLVTIDPLYSAVSMDDYMAKSAQALMVLKDFRDELGTTFMIAHHTTKKPGDGARARDDAWGSTFINAWLETGWQVRSSLEEGKVEVVRHFKAFSNPPKVSLSFNISDFHYRVSEEAAAPGTGAKPGRKNRGDVDPETVHILNNIVGRASGKKGSK